jgi:hypothetical protein
MFLKDALKKYINKECTVTTRNDEYDGVLVEVGDDYIEINDEFSSCFVTIKAIETISFEE